MCVFKCGTWTNLSFGHLQDWCLTSIIRLNIFFTLDVNQWLTSCSRWGFLPGQAGSAQHTAATDIHCMFAVLSASTLIRGKWAECSVRLRWGDRLRLLRRVHFFALRSSFIVVHHPYVLWNVVLFLLQTLTGSQLCGQHGLESMLLFLHNSFGKTQMDPIWLCHFWQEVFPLCHFSPWF